MKRIVHKHPFAIRWFHWLNFPILAVMVWSGILIYWANDVYKVGFKDRTVLKFFPDTFYQALNIPFRLAEGMSLHFIFMWFFALNGILYVLYLAFSGQWKYLLPDKRSFKDAWLVLLHDLRIRKGLPSQIKYNGAQRIAYTVIIMIGFMMLITGMAIYKPVQLNWLCRLLGGYEWARAEHFIFTIIICLFFLVHVIQVILAGWNNFRGMITGFEVKKESGKLPSDAT